MEQVRHVTTSASLQTTGSIVEHKSDVNAELEKLNASIDRVEKEIEGVSLKIDENEGKLEQTTDGSSQQTFERGWLITLGKKEAALREEKAALRKEKEKLLQKRDGKSDGASSSSLHDRLPPLPL
jgi:predicted  nucleic acid-binding Zn-ribbon protein